MGEVCRRLAARLYRGVTTSFYEASLQFGATQDPARGLTGRPLANDPLELVERPGHPSDSALSRISAVGKPVFTMVIRVLPFSSSKLTSIPSS